MAEKCHYQIPPSLAGFRSLFRALEGDNAAHHSLIGPIRHHAPRRQHLQLIAIDLERSRLLSANPLGIPCHLDLSNPLVAFDAICAGVSDQGAQQVGALLVSLRRFARTQANPRVPTLFRARKATCFGRTIARSQSATPRSDWPKQKRCRRRAGQRS
jgi:hypothetical protein